MGIPTDPIKVGEFFKIKIVLHCIMLSYFVGACKVVYDINSSFNI